MATVKAILWRHKKKKDGTSPIWLRVTKGGRCSYISIGYSIKEEDFSEKDSKVKSSFPNSIRLNNLIAKRISEIQSKAIELETEDKHTSLRQIKRKLSAPPKSDFISFGNSYIQKFNNQPQRGTFEKYKGKLCKLSTYLRNSRINFSDIDPAFLREYESHLKNIGNKPNTIHGDMRCIRAIYYAAIREGNAEQSKNPFFNFKLVFKKTKKERLSGEEMNRIRKLELSSNDKIWHARNIFLLSYNAMGMRFGDVAFLKWSNIHDDRLNYEMRKTGTNKSILLSNEAKTILDYYRGEKVKPDDYIFPFIKLNSKSFYNAKALANSRVNKLLKIIAEKAGILKRLTFHIARHSWAQTAKNHDMDLRVIQRGLGHESSRTTEIYLNDLDDNEVDIANLKILNEV